MKNVAVLGATGLVGSLVVKILEERNFPVKELFLFASEKSEGLTMPFKDQEIEILYDYKPFLEKVDLAFGCMDRTLSREIIPQFKDHGVVIDNSSAYRQEPEVPLVIPEVNPEKIREHAGIIANPNCSTIQMLVPLFPLHQQAKIKRIFVATYQSVSGYGKDAIDELKLEYEYLALEQAIEKSETSVFKYPIGNNIIPQIGNFNVEGYSEEEIKMVHETRKILSDDSIQVTPTCVRIPVLICHSEAVSVEFENPISPAKATEILKELPGIKVLTGDTDYPMPCHAAGKDEVFVGRIRKDLAFEHGLAMWIVADNVRKGAALNAVQIAELL